MGFLSSRRARRFGLGVLLTASACSIGAWWWLRTQSGPLGVVEERGELEPHVSQSYSHPDDLLLRARPGQALIVGNGHDDPSRLPVRGSLVDVRFEYQRQTPEELLLWWSPGYVQDGAFHLPHAESVQRRECEGGTGIRVVASDGAVRLTTDYCVVEEERFSITTTVINLPPGAVLADELARGTANAVVDVQGETLEGAQPSDYLVLVESDKDKGGVMLFETPGATVERHGVAASDDDFSGPLHVLHPAGTTARRSLRLMRGDVFDAFAKLPGEHRTVSVVVPELEGTGRLELLDDDGEVVAYGRLASTSRVVSIPSHLGYALRVRDEHGVTHGESAPLPESGWMDAEFARGERGLLRLSFRDEEGTALPTHVLFRGLDETADPTIFRTSKVFGAGRSVYLPYGEGEVHLPPGDYFLTASHGPSFTLFERAIHISEENELEIAQNLRRVVDTRDWVAGDFHLHAVASKDSTVPFADRVVSLACAGVDFAVPTEHNRISDYRPYLDELSLRSFETFPGIEITTSGKQQWGHFNAYPMTVPSGAQEHYVPPYFNTTPEAMFDVARERGAEIIQVNHARMAPQIGYFDIAEFDAATGVAQNQLFSDQFDALEAFNGFWIQNLDRILEGVHDLVGLARRGRRPIATGNSDSHQLLYQEAGWPRTWIHVPREPAASRGERVLEGLKARRTMISSGPFLEFLVDGQEPGATVVPKGGKVRAWLRVTAPAWVPVRDVQIWADDEIVHSFTAGAAKDGVRFERSVQVPIARDVVLTAVVLGGAPLPDVLPVKNAQSVAFTGLLYVDADGDGEIKLPQGKPRPKLTPDGH